MPGETQLRTCSLTLVALKVSCPLPPKIVSKQGAGDWNCIMNVRPESTGHTEGKAINEDKTEAWLHQLGNSGQVESWGLWASTTKINNRLGGDERNYLPRKVCAGVKRMVLSPFIHRLANNNSSVDGSCFNDAADDTNMGTVLLGQQHWIARLSTGQ